MKVSYVAFGQHVKSISAMRIGERYAGTGTIFSMDFKQDYLLIDLKDESGKAVQIVVPSSNIAFMQIILEVTK